MQPIGYLYKRVASRPEWLAVPAVKDIYSLSGCISKDFADYINYWKHNGFWLFDSPSVMRSLAREHSITLDGAKLFYYEAHELQYDSERGGWHRHQPEVAFPVNVEFLSGTTLEGFDVATFFAGTSPECSPLSCNSSAKEIATNEHCLIPTFEAAQLAVESGRFEHTEPGPYRIIAVYSVRDT